MAQLLLVSNRGPVVFRVGTDGSLVARRGGGGLVTALDGLAGEHEVSWVAHALGDGDLRAMSESGGAPITELSRQGGTYQLRFSGGPDAHYDGYYNVISNPLLWFVQHRLYGFGEAPTITRRVQRAWESYRIVNRRMAATALDELERVGSVDAVMVHDYQLLLVPGEIRAARPDVPLELFLHIPWPEPAAWRCLPPEWVMAFVDSLLDCDLVGMQTRRDCDAFLDTVRALGVSEVSIEVAAHGAVVRRGDREVHVRDYPISVAVGEFQDHRDNPAVARLRSRIEDMRPGPDGKLVVRVDRTDPSKNIVRGLQAFQLLLREHPELHERVVMFCQLDPSRQDIDEYARYMRALQVAADEVNIEFASATWQPLYLNIDSNFTAAVAAYAAYDVLFVNSVADGMNLVSKEGPLVNDRDGVLVLSETAGSFQELGEHALAVSPFDICQQAEALHEALLMDPAERARRAAGLRSVVQERDVADWARSQLQDLIGIRSHA